MESIPEIKGNNIIVCPLNWGLGHASRCIPIIKKLIKEGKQVSIGADGAALVLLIKELRGIDIHRFIELKGISVKYSRHKNQTWAILKNLPKWIGATLDEHKEIKMLTSEYGFDTIISDNRFGLWSKNTYCIYITHQVMIKAPQLLKWTEPLLHFIHSLIIKRYNECWIPDRTYNDLSGDLSHKYPQPMNAKFIGTLSKFCDNDITEASTNKKAYDTVAIVSGPEPQRSIFEEQIVKTQTANGENTLLIRGIPQEKKICTTDNITFISHLDTNEMRTALISAKRIICRSGYTTIMDLDTLGLKAEISPTPGQSEQEYLSEYLTGKGIHKKWEA